jgi:hypothetical protein
MEEHVSLFDRLASPNYVKQNIAKNEIARPYY